MHNNNPVKQTSTEQGNAAKALRELLDALYSKNHSRIKVAILEGEKVATAWGYPTQEQVKR